MTAAHESLQRGTPHEIDAISVLDNLRGQYPYTTHEINLEIDPNKELSEERVESLLTRMVTDNMPDDLSNAVIAYLAGISEMVRSGDRIQRAYLVSTTLTAVAKMTYLLFKDMQGGSGPSGHAIGAPNMPLPPTDEAGAEARIPQLDKRQPTIPARRFTSTS